MTDQSPIRDRPVRRRRKEDRPSEIIEAGFAEFGIRGFEAARMQDVARRAGVAKGTVFRYFPTKELLFEAAVKSRVGPAFSQISEAFEVHQGPVMPLLQQVIAGVYRQLVDTDITVLLRIIIAEGPRFPKIIETYHRESIALGRVLLGRIIDRGVATGEFQSSAITDVPMVVAAPALMAAIWQLTFGLLEPISTDRFMAAHLSLICHGLRA